MAAVNVLARSYRLEVSADGSTNWLRVNGLNDLNPTITPNKQDASNYESDGWMSSEITMQDWSVVAKVNRQTNAGVEDPAMALIRARVGQFGSSARLYVRWYRTDGIDEAWSGWAIIEVAHSKTAVVDLNEVTVTFTGDGVLTSISNPYVATSAPVVSSISPTSGAAAGGDLVTISGQFFTGATDVSIGGTTASSYTVISDTTISAVTPAGTAGAADVTVTTSAGTGTLTGGFTYV